VNAPFSCPKSSLSISSFGIAAQFTAKKGALARPSPDRLQQLEKKPKSVTTRKEQIKAYWNSFIGFLESHDKLVAGVSAIALVVLPSSSIWPPGIS
jgi:hypothetical protein